jgi:thiamine biosynthesis lipoprotein ApbE
LKKPAYAGFFFGTYDGNWMEIELYDNGIRFKKRCLIDLGGIAKGNAVDCVLERVPDSVNAITNINFRVFF